MKTLLRATAVMLTLTATLLPLTGCTNVESSNTDIVKTDTTSQADGMEGGHAENISISTQDIASYTNIKLSNADTDTAWSADDPVIVCAGDSATSTASSDAVLIEGQQITIVKGGTYVLQGVLSNGQVIVDLRDKTEKVHFICNGITITSSSAALWVQQADKVILTLADGSENTFTDGNDYASEDENTVAPNACIYSKEDLTINGSGTLTVNGNCNNGIHTTDDLRIVSGRINVTSVNHGLRGNGSVVVKDGEIHIDAEGDGIKSTKVDTEGKGFVDVEGGSVTISALQDGIDAAVALVVNGGILNVESGGGTVNAPAHSDDMHGGWHDWSANQNDSTDAVSTKGIKAGAILAVMQGAVQINAADDAVHCNGDTVISGGTLILAAGDDGIHSDDELTISDQANVTVTESYEGLEAYHICINGGEIRVNASDDGLNAAGGNNPSADANTAPPDPENAPQNGGGMNGAGGNNPPTDVNIAPPDPENVPQNGGGFGSRPFGGGFGGIAASSGELDITGGYLYVNAGGDGLDSNGNITMTGGVAVICGPTSNGDSPLDSGDNNNKITLTGGTLIAVGATGMMETPESNYIASASLNAAAGTLIVVTDAEGTVLGALQTPKDAQGIIFSANGANEGYTIYIGGTYEGELNADGWAMGGSYTVGTEICSGSGNIDFTGGMGGFGGKPGVRW